MDKTTPPESAACNAECWVVEVSNVEQTRLTGAALLATQQAQEDHAAISLLFVVILQHEKRDARGSRENTSSNQPGARLADSEAVGEWEREQEKEREREVKAKLRQLIAAADKEHVSSAENSSLFLTLRVREFCCTLVLLVPSCSYVSQQC